MSKVGDSFDSFHILSESEVEDLETPAMCGAKGSAPEPPLIRFASIHARPLVFCLPRGAIFFALVMAP